MQAVGELRSSSSSGTGSTPWPASANQVSASCTLPPWAESAGGVRRQRNWTRSPAAWLTVRRVGVSATACSLAKGAAGAAGAAAVASITPAQPPGRRKWVRVRGPASKAMSTSRLRGAAPSCTLICHSRLHAGVSAGAALSVAAAAAAVAAEPARSAGLSGAACAAGSPAAQVQTSSAAHQGRSQRIAGVGRDSSGRGEKCGREACMQRDGELRWPVPGLLPIA